MSTDEVADDKQKTWGEKLKAFVKDNAVLIILGFMLAQNAGWITSEQVKELKQLVLLSESHEAVKEAEELKPVPEPEPQPTPDKLTPDHVADLIRKAIEEAMKANEPAPTPAADDNPPAPQPKPPESVRIKLCDESGIELTDSEIEAGQLFRVSAVGASDISWHPVKSGEVRLSASTDGKEFCGYLEAGQWVEFSLTDFASKTQASLRVTCNQAPQPPPDDDVKPEPGPTPKARNVRLFIVYNPENITPDVAMVLNAFEMWDRFTEAGNDWQRIDFETKDEFEKNVVADARGQTLPALVIYDKGTGKLLNADELPKSIVATDALVEKFTEATR
jgi:hypothetical protein